jgi:hypothetical protein
MCKIDFKKPTEMTCMAPVDAILIASAGLCFALEHNTVSRSAVLVLKAQIQSEKLCPSYLDTQAKH